MQPSEEQGAEAGGRGPLVSCVIIFLNEEKFLAEAIESVIAQTYPNWELLLVDDGSSDRSAAIAQSYCDKDPERIRYLAHEGGANRGMSASRNLGLKEARGSLAAMLDADDIWLPAKLEQQVAIFERHPEAIMVCGATRYWHSWQTPAEGDDAIVFVGDDTPDGKATEGIEQDRLYEPVELLKLLYPLGKGVTPSTSCITFKRQTALELGGFENSFPGLFEDQAFLVKAYLAGPIYVASECVNLYRQHDNSCCYVMTATGQSAPVRRRFVQWLKNYLEEAGCRDPIVRRRLQLRMARENYPKIYRFMQRVARRLRSLKSRPSAPLRQPQFR